MTIALCVFHLGIKWLFWKQTHAKWAQHCFILNKHKSNIIILDTQVSLPYLPDILCFREHQQRFVSEHKQRLQGKMNAQSVTWGVLLVCSHRHLIQKDIIVCLRNLFSLISLYLLTSQVLVILTTGNIISPFCTTIHFSTLTN